VSFDFDAPIERADTWSIRWDRYAGRDVIPLWVADTDFRPPPAVLKALTSRLSHGILGYTAPPKALRTTIVERLARLYRWQVEPDWIVFIPGVVPGLHHAVRTLTEPGERIVVPTPVYQHLTRAAELAPRPWERAPLVLEHGRWILDLASFREAVRDSRAFLLCNPQNPGGTVFTSSELRQLAELSQDLLIVSDEIHCDLILDEGKRHVPIASLAPEICRRCVTLMSPNKSFNFPAAGCAWAIIEDPLLRRAFSADIDAHAMPLPSVFGYAAALAAYCEGDAWLDAQTAYLRGNRDLVEGEIGSLPGMSMAHIEATYLAWIDCSELPVENPHQHFLEHGVALSPGSQFGDSRFVRLNFGTQRSRLAAALARMRASLPTA
jgi:cysteine-S-conjugate beta-lyase